MIKFAKVKENAIIPTKRPEDAGYDIYACFGEDFMMIRPGETKLIPTGIASAFSKEYVVILKERGSTGTKGLGQRCGVVDSGYRNEYFAPITNHGTKPIAICKSDAVCMMPEDVVVYPYEKAICQALILPLIQEIPEEVSYEELKAIPSDRGLGALGSSGK